MKQTSKIRSFSRATRNLMGCATLIVLAQGQTRAALVFDFSPDTTGAPFRGASYLNQYGSQIIGDQFTLLEDTTITGAAIFSGNTFGMVGDSARLLIFDDVAGVPAAVPTIDLTTTIDAVDTLYTTTIDGRLTRKHATITPTMISAGTYWFSMPGDGVDLAQSSTFSGDSWLGSTYLERSFLGGDIFFQLEGTTAPVPEPTSALLFGLAALGFSARRRR